MRGTRWIVSFALWSLVLACVSTTNAATFVVDSTLDAPDAVPGDGVCASDDGLCTLRAATMEGNALPGHDTIELPGGTYALTRQLLNPPIFDGSEGYLLLVDDTTILGSGAESTIIDAAPLNNRVLVARGNTNDYEPRLYVEIDSVTVTGGGRQPWATSCAGIRFEGTGSLTVRDSIITNNHAVDNGGGICLFGVRERSELYVFDSKIIGNSGHSGGGIYGGLGNAEVIRTVVSDNKTFNENSRDTGYWGGGISFGGGNLFIVDSEISNNFAGRAGGGIYAHGADVLLERTTVSGNMADNAWDFDLYDDGTGGGIWADRSELHLFNSTISGNTATKSAGGIFLMDGAFYPYWNTPYHESGFVFAFSTIANNRTLSGSDGAGVRTLLLHDLQFKYELLKGTIIAGNQNDVIVDNCDLVSPADTLGFNISDDSSCGLDHPTDRPAVDPDLDGLANNGGPTATNGLLPGSVAVDLVPPNECTIPWSEDWAWETFPFFVDQRGVPRPVGGGCDAGSVEFEGELSVEEHIEELIIDVRELIDDGEVSSGKGRGLIAELQVALWFLKYSGGEMLAAVRLEIFIIKVEGMIDRNEVDPELGADLLTRARAILDLLRA